MNPRQPKILIVAPAWVGDMVMAQCLFKLIKQNDPDAMIDVLAPAWTFSILSRMSEVRQAIALPFAHGELNLRGRYLLAKQLRAEQYDQAIVLPNSLKSALIPWLAGIPKRTGWLGECRYGLLNDARRLDKKRYPLMIEQFMALGLDAHAALPAEYPKPSFQVTETSQTATLTKLKITCRAAPVLAICAGAEFGPAKRWPEEYYAQIANQKLADGWQVWLFGSPKDKPVTDKIMALTENRCENIAGKAELAETIDLLSLVSGVVTNDSGLMHIASALNKPLVALYGSTSPAFTPPLGTMATILQEKLACQPCFERTCPLKHFRCMRDLTPNRVIDVMSVWEV